MPDKNDKRNDNYIRLMIPSEDKVRVKAMCKDLKIGMSEDIRAYLSGRLAQYELGRKR